MRLPDFIGIGAMRSGSTTLWHLLHQHTQVFLPDRKELHFFDNREGNWERGVEFYARFFEPAPSNRVCGEITPSYLYIEEACERIRSVVPATRLIVILRDPVVRTWSHYWYTVLGGWERLGFEDALAAEHRRTTGASVDARLKYSYVARGHYFEQLRRFEECFSREQLCVILLEDLRQRPYETMHGVFAHLGLDPVPKDPSDTGAPRANRSSHPRARRVHYHNARLLRRANRGDTLGHKLGRRLARLIRHVNLTPGTPEMPPHIRDQLAQEFAESNRKVAEWLGRPLPWTQVPE